MLPFGNRQTEQVYFSRVGPILGEKRSKSGQSKRFGVPSSGKDGPNWRFFGKAFSSADFFTVASATVRLMGTNLRTSKIGHFRARRELPSPRAEKTGWKAAFWACVLSVSPIRTIFLRMCAECNSWWPHTLETFKTVKMGLMESFPNFRTISEGAICRFGI